MKKLSITIMMFVAVFMTGCSAYHQSKHGILLQNPYVEMTPLEVDLKVGEKITGMAECQKLFGLTIAAPKRLAYGAELQGADGDIAPAACTKGAIYDAMSRNNADTIIAPHYTVVKSSFLFIYSKTKIIVTGYKGTFGPIKEMNAETIKSRRANGVGAHVPAKTKKGLF